MTPWWMTSAHSSASGCGKPWKPGCEAWDDGHAGALREQLTQCTAGSGILLLSAYRKADDPESQRWVFKVAKQRLVNRGVPPETLDAIFNSRNSVVFSLDPGRVSALLAQAGWPSALQLYQSLFSRLWLCQTQS